MLFCATVTDKSKIKYSKPILFNSVKVNEGRCYDNTTGKFTTTVPGTYVFIATLGSTVKNENVTAYITVDDTAYTIFRGSYTSTGSSSVLVRLGLGQRVWVKADSNADWYYPDELCFTGALVQPQLWHADDDDDDDDADDDVYYNYYYYYYSACIRLEYYY